MGLSASKPGPHHPGVCLTCPGNEAVNLIRIQFQGNKIGRKALDWLHSRKRDQELPGRWFVRYDQDRELVMLAYLPEDGINEYDIRKLTQNAEELVTGLSVTILSTGFTEIQGHFGVTFEFPG